MKEREEEVKVDNRKERERRGEVKGIDGKGEREREEERSEGGR